MALSTSEPRRSVPNPTTPRDAYGTAEAKPDGSFGRDWLACRANQPARLPRGGGRVGRNVAAVLLVRPTGRWTAYPVVLRMVAEVAVLPRSGAGEAPSNSRADQLT
jgi:hypothetical protein